jgi:hypothetical protein
MGLDALKDYGAHNAIGRFCTTMSKEGKNRTRCMAGTHLYDAAMSARDAVQAAASGLATAPTVAGGLFFGGLAVYSLFKTADSLVAGLRQSITGEETDSVADIATKKTGAWIKKKWYGEEATDKPAAEAPAAPPAAPPAADAPMRGGFGPADPSSGSGTAVV